MTCGQSRLSADRRLFFSHCGNSVDKRSRAGYNNCVIKTHDKYDKQFRPVRNGEGMKVSRSMRKRGFLCLWAAALFALLFALSACAGPSEDRNEPAVPPERVSDISFPPEDGTLPEAYGGAENAAFLAGKLAGRTLYHSESVVDVTASVLFIDAGQKVYGSKDYKDGILLTSSVSVSDNAFAPSRAIQRWFGEDKAIVRGAASDPSVWEGSDVEWSADAPAEVLDRETYAARYGLWGDELTDYVITSETILSSTPAAKGEDGNYTMTLSLDPQASTYYYQNQMVTMGDLDEPPVFSSVELTFTFGADWTLYSLRIEEEYSSKKLVTASCKGSALVTFSYEEEDVDVSAYEAYFKQYADEDTTGQEEDARTAADYIAEGLAPLFEQEAALDVTAAADGVSVSAKLLLDMRGRVFRSLKGQAGALTFAYEGDRIYLSYKDLQGYVQAGEFAALAGVPAAAAGVQDLDLDAVFAALAGASVEKEGEDVTLSCALSAGLPAELRLSFTEKEDAVTFTGAEARISAFGKEISVQAVPAAETPEIEVPEKAVDLAPYIRSIAALAQGGKYDLTLSFAQPALGVSVKGSLLVDAPAGALRGEWEFGIAGQILPVSFTCLEGTVYLRVFDIRIKASVSEVSALVNGILAQAGVTLPEMPQADAGEIVAALLALPYDSMIKELSLTEEGLIAVINADGLLSSLTGGNVVLGDIAAAFDPEEGAVIAAAGAQISLRGSAEEVVAPAGEYVALSDLEAFFGSEAFTFAAQWSQGDVSVAADGRLSAAGEMPALTARVLVADGGSSHYAEVTFAEGMLWASYSRAGFGADTALKIKLPASSLAEAAEGLAPILEMLGIDLSGVDVSALLAGVLSPVSAAEIEWEGDALRITAGGLSLTIAAAHDAASVLPPEEEGYMDMSFLPQLVGDVTETASHFASGYDLSAKLFASISGQTVLDADVRVKIGFDESGVLCAQISLDIAGWGLFFTGEAHTEIVLSGGNIYIVREQTSVYDAATGAPVPLEEPSVERRAMTAEHFLLTAEEQLYFALNVSETLQGLIEETSGMLLGTPGDVGEWFTVAGRLSSSEGADGHYAVTLDLGKILGGSLLSGEVSLRLYRGEGGILSAEAEGALNAMGMLRLDLKGTQIVVNAPGEAVDMDGAGEALAALAEAFGYADGAALAAAVAEGGMLAC